MAEVRMERTSLDAGGPKKPPKTEETSIERKAATQVAKANVEKPSFAQRFLDTLGLEDGRTVGDTLMWDVIVPTVKDLVYNIFTQGMSVFLYGSAGAKATPRPRSGRGGYSSYGDYYSGPRGAVTVGRGSRSDYRHDQSYPVRRNNTMDFSTIQFEDYVDEDGHLVTGKVQAQLVLDSMLEMIDIYEWCKVSDFLSAAGVPESEVNFTDMALGWDSLGSATPMRARNGKWFLGLPRPKHRDE